jgi:membrane protease YdiL (CAAX protease family)
MLAGTPDGPAAPGQRPGAPEAESAAALSGVGLADGAAGAVAEEPLGPRRMTTEIWLLLSVSLGMSGLIALIRFIGDVTKGPVRGQVALLNGSAAPGRPWLDLALQLAYLLADLAPAFLALHLLARHGGGARAIGLDRRRLPRDLALGAGLAAGVGGVGLGLYLLAWHSGANLTVAPSGLPAVWWRIPVLLLSAAQNAVTEEVIVAGYLLVRLRELGWGNRRALGASALLRGSYHLYQGLGGFGGNVAMGVLFGWLFQRRGRVVPLIVAHTLIDSVAFVGYVALAGHVSWLPTAG